MIEPNLWPRPDMPVAGLVRTSMISRLAFLTPQTGELMNLDRYRYFLAAARFQSVQMGARAVALSPSAVSAAIRQLEEEYGHKFFRREGKAIFLNDQGRLLQKELTRILEDVEGVRRRLSGKTTSLQGHYRLAGSPYLASRLLCSVWTSLQARHPGLQGDLTAGHTSRVLAELLQGTLDFGLCFSPQLHPDLRQFTLHTGQLRVAVRKKHPVLRLSGKQGVVPRLVET